MRPALAVFIALFFSVLFIVTLLISRVVNTAGDPQEVAGLIEDSDIYDFAYDRVLEAALNDVVSKGVSVEFAGNEPETLEFDDPAQARAAIKGFIETVLPREYVREKVEEALNGLIPYASGRTNSFEIDLETSERIDALPEAVRVAAERIALGELIMTELVAPIIHDVSGSITDQALGIELTPEEAEDAARRILPPEWIEQQVFSFFDQAAPYFAGTEEDLNVTITFKDRVPVAGQVLKEKLNDEDTLTRLVFEEVVDPLVAQFAQDSEVLVFGIALTETDIQDAVAAVAPADWVQAQGDGIIDSVVAWLVGATDTLEYTLELEQRKAEASTELEALAIQKLNDQVAATPVCQNPAEAGAALNDALNKVFPSCLPDNASEVLGVMQPLIGAEVSNYVERNIPDEITYSDADLRAQLGADSLDTLDSLREYVINGFSFTEEDLVNQFASGDNPESVANFREALDVARAGFVFNETEITDRMDPPQLAQFNQVRDYINLGWKFRWGIFLPALLLLLGVAFIGGGGWPGRAKWAGATVAVVSVIFFGAIQVGWASTASLRESALPDNIITADSTGSFPTLAALVNNGELRNMAERVGSSWISGLAMSALPWAIGGIVLFGLGFGYPKYRERLVASRRNPDGSPPERPHSVPPGDPVTHIPDMPGEGEEMGDQGETETPGEGRPGEAA